MKDHHREHARLSRHSGGSHDTSSVLEPALQVICLASGGGPAEDNVTGFLVRSASTSWSKGSVLAVDAGSHLSAITRILESDFPRVSPPEKVPVVQDGKDDHERAADQSQSSDSYSSRSVSSSPEPQYTTLNTGPFAGISLPFETARANALHIVRECVATYLITHPHLDHLCALAINTAAFHNTSRPKRLAALPSTVNAIKTHIFNDVIWPNLTDEDGGVGFVTFQRLAQGGNIAVGEGPTKGYMEVCDGICVKGMKISHGHCLKGPDTTFHRSSDVGLSEATVLKGSNLPQPQEHTFSPQFKHRTPSITQMSQPGTPGIPAATGSSGPVDMTHREVVVDSTAYFIREDKTGREILFFGDVEPDALSLNPRNAVVWAEAAPKIANGHLRAIFIECSYDDSQADAVLFGHLAPRHLFHELGVLADMTRQKRIEEREKRHSRKRKRHHQHSSSLNAAPSVHFSPTSFLHAEDHFAVPRKRARSADKHKPVAPDEHVDPLSRTSEDDQSHQTSRLPSPILGAASDIYSTPPLLGVSIIIMHMKDTLRDGPLVGENILRQLHEHEAALRAQDGGVGLGCEFIISKVGGSYHF